MPTLTRSGDIYTLDLGDGENRLNPTTCGEILACLDELDAAPAPRALVTTASGKFFSNGLDLDWAGGDAGRFFACAESLTEVMGRIAFNDAPTVAAIGGHCYAGGALLALAHDHRVMRADRGFWCLPEVDLGMVFASEWASLARSKMPPAALRDAMLFGRRFGGVAAAEAGLVDEAAAEDQVVARATALVADVAPKAGRTMGGIKRRVYAEAAAAFATAFTGD